MSNNNYLADANIYDQNKEAHIWKDIDGIRQMEWHTQIDMFLGALQS